MKTIKLNRLAAVMVAALAALTPPVIAQTPAAPPPAAPAPPPSAPAQRSAADLEKLVAPIALYPDSLIATILPASVYPLEIVQAARFVANTNNLAKLDEQPWDENVKAVARVPEVIKQMNDDLSWTMELGEAFLAQDKDVMTAMQSMRAKAQQVGTLQTTPQQIVTVTNMIIEKTIEQQVVVVTNTIIQIVPSNPEVIYVPTYNPTVVYYVPAPTYVGPPPVVTFAAGVAVGLIIANNCDWHYGGCYHSDVNVNRNVTVNNNYNQNVNNNYNQNVNNGNNNNSGQRPGSGSNPGGQRPGGGNVGQQPSQLPAQKWQPDQSRLSKSGSPGAANSAKTMEARGWNAGGAAATTRPATAPANRPATAATQPANRPAAPSQPRPSYNQPAQTPNTRPAASPGRTQPAPNQSANRAAPASNARPGGSAFSGVNNSAATRSSSSRGASSRGSFGGGGGGGGRGGGGGGRR